MFKKSLFLIFLLHFAQGCIEPFDAEIVDFESVLVIEALITNEMKRHEVTLTRTFKFEEGELIAESNANVRIVDNAGNTFTFSEIDTSGRYISEVPFAIATERSYRLLITTENGNNYSSDEEITPAVTQIDGIRAEKIVNDSGEDGIAILADSFDSSRNSNFYRYTYEETYKVIAPKWSPLDLVADPNDDCGLITVPKETEQQVCYASNKSNTILIISTTNLEEDRVDGFQVLFLNRNNYIISHRYSILVKQHIQSNKAYQFYERLKEFSDSESLFSQIQPGFLEGNIKVENNTTERVIGYFEVATVSEQRIFFNYEDFYPGEELPPYIEPCSESAPLLIDPLGGDCLLRPIIERGRAKFFKNNPESNAEEGPFLVVPRICGDCTVLGDANIPEFWIE